MSDDGRAGTSSVAEQSWRRLDGRADDDGAPQPPAGRWLRRRLEKLTDIRNWVAAVFARSVSAGEQLLEDGRLADAAAAFANAMLLTDRAGAFAAAVRRVYPSYFYRLFERRMTSMGYGHLFGVDAAPPHHGSPVNGSQLQG